jgi:hypothetical protein
MAEAAGTIFEQELDLNLYDQSPDRLRAMKTLSFAKHIKDFRLFWYS